MSKKRFVLDKLEKGNAILSIRITDSVTDDNYFIMTREAYEDDIDEIVGVLNDQQATINRQTEQHKARLDKLIEEIGELQMKNVEQQATITELESDKAIAEDYANIFEKENVKLRKQIGEQQATIQELEEENASLKQRIRDITYNNCGDINAK